MSDAATIEIEIDNNYNDNDEIIIDDTGNDKIDIDHDIDKLVKPHHYNRPITLIEISPNGKYLVTYSRDDNSIVGWNVQDKDDSPIELDKRFPLVYEIKKLCVSDDKQLVCLGGEPINDTIKGIYDMKYDYKKIDLDYDINHYFDCIFNLKGEFVLYDFNDGKIFIYTTQTENNKWKCKKIYKIPRDSKVIGISKYDKLYLSSDNSIYEWDFITEKIIKMNNRNGMIYERSKFYSDRIYKLHQISEFCNNKIIFINFENKITIYSNELEIPVVSLDINSELYTQLVYIFIHLIGLNSLLYPLLINSKQYWKEHILKDKGQLSEHQLRSFLNNVQTSKYVLGILDGNIWKFKLNEILAGMNLPYENSNEIIENWYLYDDFNDFKEIFSACHHLNIHLLSLNMEDVSAVFQIAKHGQRIELNHNLTKWKIYCESNLNIKLEVFKKINANISWDKCDECDLACTRVEKLNQSDNVHRVILLINIKFLDGNNIVLLTTVGLFIYHLNENDKSISLNYYYHMDIQSTNYKKIFLGSTLPLPNYKSFKLCDGWVSDIKNNKHSLLKYGVALLTFGIKEHKLDLVEDIYKECMFHFEEDLENNMIFLSIITSIMRLLNEFYPEYTSRYSLDTIMITDSFYSIEYKNINLHLHSFFQYPHITDLTWSYKCKKLMNHIYIKRIHRILKIIRLLLFPIIFIIRIVINKFRPIYFHFINFINNIFENIKIIKHTKTIPIITFMNPYIKFVTYPQNYNWFLELIMPQSSPFVKIISKDIYETWNGETLINFKWNKYGKYYYTIIWFGFIVLLGCFTAAATIPQEYIDDNIQKQLLIASIILGFIHLSFKVRQFIYNPIKWVNNFWNIFDLIAFLFPIYTSIHWLQTNDRNIQFLSFSCLFLDIKFLLFLRVYESFGVYFAIIISVGKQAASFLVVLFIIIISFAHTFYILLSPEPTDDHDPNNPWNIAPVYHRIFENGTIDPNPYLIQPPGKNTNMFIDFGTAVFAIYQFLTGDSSALSNWTYKDNPSLVILIVFFSFLTIVYLMNLLVGLLGNAIEKDNNRVTYLVQKAEVLAEIELFYLLPHQRRWKTWFPDIIYYYADVDKTRQKVKEMIKEGEWNINEFSELKLELLKVLGIQHNSHNPVDEATLHKVLKETPLVDEATLRRVLEEILVSQKQSSH
ncbi:hypothetical protein RclHR1_03320003 [Rhizophagus clarus]|uniref:Ion transport domain-containing protein n=1 Tax=Rhizophagus clarus TaxID=94130 RepID=A0A2Z6R8U6_9GLOM|nr:hypothetical protein RclHR1_03320003 [Rhizophagus clarus]